MPRLIIKRGEETGKVIDLRDGSFTIGRNPNNEIVLHSPAISKQHARLTVKGRQVIIEDLGSANGTFVNGAMITSYQLKTGDQINFRDITLELLDGEPVHLNQPTQSLGTGTYGLPLPHVLQGTPQGTPHLQLVHNSINREGPLKTLFQNIGRFCQDQILPLFYKLVESIEWHLVVAGLSIIFIVATVVMTVAPLSTQSKAYLQSETRKKAIFLAKQLAEENRRGVYLKNEVILSTKVVDGEERVLGATIVDRKGRIMAPASRMNLTVSDAPALEALRHEETFVKSTGEDQILVSEPIYVFSQADGKNVIGGFAQVTYSLRGIGLTNAGITRIFITALLWALLLGILYYGVIIRITLRPLEQLADDIESHMGQGYKNITRRFRFHALDNVMRKINALFVRIRESAHGNEAFATTEEIKTQEDNRRYRALSLLVEIPTLLINLEGIIEEINLGAEELFRTTAASAIGQPLSQIVSDITLTSTFVSLMNQLSVSHQDRAFEEISTQEGLSYRITAGSIRDADGNISGAILTIVRIDLS